MFLTGRRAGLAEQRGHAGAFGLRRRGVERIAQREHELPSSAASVIFSASPA